MPTNRLMGSGPSPAGGGTEGGPSPGISGTLGNAPQAAPQQFPGAPTGNMLSAPPAAPQGGVPGAQQPITPPSLETLMDVSHKQSVVTAHLKALLGKPDLKTRDILNAVGEVVADGVMSPFDAAKNLADLPSNDADPLQLRKWVAQHYTNASKAFGTVSEMIAAHGEMTRRQQMPMQQMPQAMPQSAPANQFGMMG